MRRSEVDVVAESELLPALLRGDQARAGSATRSATTPQLSSNGRSIGNGGRMS